MLLSISVGPALIRRPVLVTDMYTCLEVKLAPNIHQASCLASYTAQACFYTSHCRDGTCVYSWAVHASNIDFLWHAVKFITHTHRVHVKKTKCSVTHNRQGSYCWAILLLFRIQFLYPPGSSVVDKMNVWNGKKSTVGEGKGTAVKTKEGTEKRRRWKTWKTILILIIPIIQVILIITITFQGWGQYPKKKKGVLQKRFDNN